MTDAATPRAVGRHGRAVAAHTRTLVLGLALVSGALLFLFVAGLVSGIPADEAAFLVPFILAPAIGAVLAHRFGTWARVLGVVIVLAVVAMTFFLAFGLFQPASFVEFTSSVAYVLGVLLTLYGGIASIVGRRDLRPEPTSSELRLRRTSLGLVALALVVSLPLWFLTRSTVDAEVAAGLQEVTATNFAFEDVTAGAGESIVVRNTDPFHHTFTIDELGIDVDLLPGEAVVVDLPDATGTYTYYCVPHSMDGGNGADDMAATLALE